MTLLRLLPAILIVPAFTLHAAAQANPAGSSISAPSISAPSISAPIQAKPNLVPLPPLTITPGSFHVISPPFPSGQLMPLQIPQKGSASDPLILLHNSEASLAGQHPKTCATLRTYGFTAHDLKSYDPHPSTYTTCTSPNVSSLKQVQIAPATVRLINATQSNAGPAIK